MILFCILALLNINTLTNVKLSYSPKTSVILPSCIDIKPLVVGDSIIMKTISYKGYTLTVYEDGRVFKHARVVVSELGNIRTLKSKFIKAYDNGNGYKYIHLWYENRHQSISVHRLVALTYLPNPNNFPEVNHIDGNKANNHVSNLEWCDRAYNVNDYVSKGRGVYEKFKVLCFDKNGRLIKEYPSLESTGMENGWNSENVFFVVSGKFNTAYGYYWIYKHNYISEIHTTEFIKNKFINPFKKPVIVKRNGIIIGEYSSISKAASDLFPASPLTARNKIRECLNKKIKHYHNYEFTQTI